MRRKEIQILLIERDKVIDAQNKLEEDRRAGRISELDHDLLRERYENKFHEIEQKLGKPKPKPIKLEKLRFWRKKSKRKT